MTTIKLKNGSGAPTAGDLVQGEPALDLTNKRLYTENASGTVIEVGINPTSITTGDITATGTATFANLATSGDVTFGDNDKAIFGAGSDLQIYHDGSNSYVKDSGAGQFYIQGSAAVHITDPTGNSMARFVDGGTTELYHNGSKKIETTSTGIDVTGTITADDITLSDADTPTLTLTDTTNTVTNIVKSDNSVGTVGTSTTHDLYIQSNNAVRQRVRSNGDISFYNDAGTSQDLYWDASTSRLGLGETNPAGALHIHGGSYGEQFISSSNSALRFVSTGGVNYIQSGTATSSSSAADLIFTNVGGSGETMRITSAGNVGIGTSSPTANLEISAATSRKLDVVDTTGARVRLSTASGQTYVGSTTAHPLNIITNDAIRATIDSSGNLLIGKSAAALSNAGVRIQNYSGIQGVVYISKTVSGNVNALANYHNGTYVGGINYSDTATSFPTSSDQRLKENIVDAPSASDDIDAIQVRSFDWKADGSHQKYGMVAQELQTVAPEAVTGDADSEDMMGVDYSKLVPMLVKEIQSLRARVAQLEGAN